MKIRFTDLDSWKGEFHERPPNVEPIVRVTYRREQVMGAFIRLYILVTYLREPRPGIKPHLVHLLEYQGELNNGVAANQEPKDRAIVDQARARVAELTGWIQSHDMQYAVENATSLGTRDFVFPKIWVADGVYEGD